MMSQPHSTVVVKGLGPVLVLLLMFCAASAGRAQSPWYVSYEKALTAQEEGDWKGSVQLLKDAIASKNDEKLKARTYGLRFINYLPYYHLGLAYYHTMDRRKALENFDASLRQGAIAGDPDDYEEIQSLVKELGGIAATPAVQEPVAAAGTPAPARKEPAAASSPGRKIVVPPPVAAPKTSAGALSPGRRTTAELREPVSRESAGGVPWYVNYETGLAYIESGDWLKAIENLKLALAAKGLPSRYARTYGMWFVTYVPYYYLGLAYFNQGLWQFAVNYFETAERLGEVRELEAESANLASLLKEARKRNAAGSKRPSSEELKGMLNTALTEAIRLYNLQETDRAKSKFESVLQLDPYNSVAKSYLARMPKEPPGDAPEPPVDADFSAGVVQLLRGNQERAIKFLIAAEPTMKDDPALHAYLGVAYALRYRSTGKKDKVALGNARREFGTTLSLDPSYQLDRSLFSRDVLDVFQSVKKNPPK
jgi:tetratricopeptide (TPR) repeat protein